MAGQRAGHPAATWRRSPSPPAGSSTMGSSRYWAPHGLVAAVPRPVRLARAAGGQRRPPSASPARSGLCRTMTAATLPPGQRALGCLLRVPPASAVPLVDGCAGRIATILPVANGRLKTARSSSASYCSSPCSDWCRGWRGRVVGLPVVGRGSSAVPASEIAPDILTSLAPVLGPVAWATAKMPAGPDRRP